MSQHCSSCCRGWLRHSSSSCIGLALFQLNWEPLLVELPRGVHQIIIDGQRGPTGISGIAIDDIRLAMCENLSEWSLKLHDQCIYFLGGKLMLWEDN